MHRSIFTTILMLFMTLLAAQQPQRVPFDHIISDEELIDLLKSDKDELLAIKRTFEYGQRDQALEELAEYFKEVFSKRYFFDWKEFEERFEQYNKIYSRRNYHFNTANQHLDLYPADVKWKLPFKNLKGDEVSAYQYRHLTRQHKAGDIAFLYFYTKDIQYLNYIPDQAESLNKAFNKGEFETIEDGNGAYESYRAGNRMYNWLFTHQCLLASEEYTWQQQLIMIKTFLHTGAKLYYHNSSYSEGNHQTRGMSALAILSIIFMDINGTDLWLERSRAILEEHLEKEIYPDNFQFERSVHYHISDINNYTLPYQIARINHVGFGPIWDEKIEGLFDAFVKLAMPNRDNPVLQDDTNAPWAESNDIGGIMAYGTALFGKPELKYFASSKISADDYWFLTSDQIRKFEEAVKIKPVVRSTEFPFTGYYIMRTGWDPDDLYMIISAGLSKEKPDHQHGDMLGIEAYAYGNMILPNYQVRYNLPDYDFFKNSWVKNVALVDSVLQGQNWTGNKGGSGFGKFGTLPQPEVLAWSKSKELDLFIGRHNGFTELGVDYSRIVFFIKDGFWIVKDVFKSKNKERFFQQIWQGHYSEESTGQHYRSVFPNGAGLEIVQLGSPGSRYRNGSFRGKGNLLIESDKASDFVFTTLLLPFKNFDERLLETEGFENFKIDDWTVTKNINDSNLVNSHTDAAVELRSHNLALLIDVSFYKKDNISLNINNARSNLYLSMEENYWEVINCGIEDIKLTINGISFTLKPGDKNELIW